MEKEKVARINELARLKKERELTEMEAAERKALHEEYLKEIRLSFGATLENTVIRRPDGSEEKLKKHDKK